MSDLSGLIERNATVAKVIADNSRALMQMANPDPVRPAKPETPTAPGGATGTEPQATTE